jgi:hypothetical protein
VADNTGGCGRRPLIVCRFSHLLLRKYCVLLRKLVEMAGNTGLDRIHAAFRTSNVVLSLWRGVFLADSVCPSIFRAVSSTSTSSLGIQHPKPQTGIADHRSRPHVLRLRQLDRRGHATRSRHVARSGGEFLHTVTTLAAGEVRWWRRLHRKDDRS